MSTTNLVVRMDPKLKRKAKKIFEKQGLDMSTAVKMFFSQAVIEKGIPFKPVHTQADLKKDYTAGIEEALRNGKEYKTGKDAIVDLIN